VKEPQYSSIYKAFVVPKVRKSSARPSLTGVSKGLMNSIEEVPAIVT
jgi:hypothetical protein